MEKINYIKNNITLIIYVLFFNLMGTFVYGANIYVDYTLNSNITNGSYSTANRDNNGSDGNAYRTIQAAVNAMVSSDDIFIRGGTYQEGSITVPLGKDGSASDFSSIQSYPGEWAVLDGVGGLESYVIGFRCYDKDGRNQHRYWKYERLEIKNGSNEGLFMSGGPFIIRYNYFHDNISPSSGANPGAIKGMIWHDSLIEYNRFEDNGSPGRPSENGNHIAIHSDYSHAHGHDWRYAGLYDAENCTRNNEIRYNYFIDNDDIAHAAYRHKAQQAFTPIVGPPDGNTGATLTTPVMTYKNFGDKFHHNIVVNSDVQMDQDFSQVYNNIIINGNLVGGHPRLFSAVKAVFYNNTIIGDVGMIMEYNNFAGPFNPGNSPGETIPVWWYAYNNIINPGGQDSYNNAITIAGEGPNYVDIDMNRNDMQRNYIYNPVFSTRNNDTVMIGNDYEHSDRSMNVATFDALYGYTNYETRSGSDLFVDTSGVNTYVTNGNHSVESGVTIADGGIGGNHPYLENIIIPTYIGATDPNDNSWVGDVLSLNTDCMRSGQCGTDSDVILPGSPTNLTINESGVLNWNVPAGSVDGYRIYYGLAEGNYPFSQEVGNITEYALDNFALNEEVTYYFIVRAYNHEGESADSNVASYFLTSSNDTTPPLPPDGVSAMIDGGDIILSWNPNTELDISTYRIYYGTATRNYELPITSQNDAYTLSGLITGITYYLSITAVDTSGNESGFSSPEVSVLLLPTTPDTIAPVVTILSPTTDTSYETESGTLEIGGTASDTVGVTQVLWANSRNTEWTGTATGTNNWSVSNIPMAEGVNEITVTAHDEAGNTSTDTLTIVYTLSSGDFQLDIRINNGIDDIEEHIATGRIDSTSSDLELADDLSAGKQLIGLRFRGIDIPQGALIQRAYIEFETDETKSGAASLDITIESVDNASEFSTTLNNLSNRITSNNHVAWSDVEAWNVINEKHQTPNINILVQEIIRRPGWKQGNSIVFILTGNGLRTAESFNGESMAAPLLHIEYSLQSISDTTAPVVTITSPTNNPSYNIEAASLDLGGTASDAIGVTQVTWSNSAGGNGTASGTTSWSVNGINLIEGENIIRIMARDAAGNESTDVLSVIYTKIDTTVPIVEITLPTSEILYTTGSASLNIGGTASDNTGVTQVLWNNSAGGSGTASGTVNWSVTGISLSEGENILTITASDVAGNDSIDQLTVDYVKPDVTAPSVVIDSPTSHTDYSTDQPVINISGTASDNNGIAQVVWSNTTGGSGTAVGTTSWIVNSVPLSEGENIITITAQDASGNQSSDAITIQYVTQSQDTIPPVIKLISPTTRRYLFTRSTTVSLKGNASDNVGIKEITWNNEQVGDIGKALGTDDWSIPDIKLAKYWNVIKIKAVDFSGNESVYNFYVLSWY